MTANGLDQVYYDVVRWQRVTFPRRDPAALSRHLAREAKELQAEIEAGSFLVSVANELADVAILLFGIADSLRLDLTSCIERKLEINKSRTWKEPDEHGVIEHERD